MHIHHLNCATFCPYGRKLLSGEGGVLEPGRLTCHCLLIETSERLVLVDTGFGTREIRQPRQRTGPIWRSLMRPKLDMGETAIEQVRALGYSAQDVSSIVLTHLDFDHAGGLADFPRAEVHVSRTEFDEADRPGGLWKRRRYKREQWSHDPLWVFHGLEGDDWFGFKAVRALPGVDPEILLVPLFGHTEGHCGVAIKRNGGWILHCGDAYFHHAEVDPSEPGAPVGVKAYQQLYQKHPHARIENQARLRELVREHGGEVHVLCSHDPYYLDALTREPAAGERPEVVVRPSGISAAVLGNGVVR